MVDERLAIIETKVDGMASTLISIDLKLDKVSEIGERTAKLEGSFRAFKWITGLAVSSGIVAVLIGVLT